MWIKKQEYNQMRDMIKYLKDYKQELISKLETLGMFNEALREEIERRTALENRRKSDARMKERKESHEYAKLCLEKAKYELDCGNAQNAKLLFAEYEENIDYRVEEDAKKDETKTDAFNEAAKPLMEWMGNNCNPHHEAIVNCMGAQLLSGEIGVPSPMAIKYREEKENE
ncbi:MAG TPA: hypothetical protein VLS94_09020 [Fusibacter sp.]|nr:hypothetical protein [Fusibacter sp.]